MPTSKKLVDKYEYNEDQIRSDCLCELITAKHIVLKQLFTLKKVCINIPKTIAKHHGVVNQMNILKNLGDHPNLFKCHKMLKTSHNLYVVYDLMGKYPTLSHLLENKLINGQVKKKNIALQVLKFLKQLKSKNIFYLDTNVKIIEVDQNQRIKFLNMQNAIFSNKNASSLSFLNIQVSSDLSPELKQLIEDCCALPYEKDIDFTLFNQKLDKADLYAFGKILTRLFLSQIQFFDNSSTEIAKIGNFEMDVKKLVEKLLSQSKYDRPGYDEIQNVLLQTNRIQQEQEKKPKIKISRRQKSNLKVSFVESDLKKSHSLMKSSNINNLNASQFLSPNIQDDFDTKSIRSSGDFTDSTTISKMKLKRRKGSFNQVESEQSFSVEYKAFVLKVMKRRNLCRFLLNLSKIVFELQLIDQLPRVMLAFMLMKKSVLLICSLARYISTGKGQSEQFDIKQPARKQFAKTNDFFRLSVAISNVSTNLDKQMDVGRSCYQGMVEQLTSAFPQLNETKQFNFSYECKSQNLNEKFMKQLIKKSLNQILRRLQNPLKVQDSIRKSAQTGRKTQRNYLHPGDSISQKRLLRTSAGRSKKQNSFLDMDDITSVVSARTVRTKISRQNNVGDMSLQNFQNEFVQRNLQFDNLVNMYLMGLILDFETYEKMFQNLIVDQKIQFNQQSLLKKLKKMQGRQIAYKIYEIIN